MGSNKNNRIFKIFQYTVLILIACVQIYPLIWLLTFSLKSNQEIFGANPMALPEKYMFSNYSKILFEGNLIRYFFNSTFVTFVSIAISTLLSAMAAYAIARMRWKWKDNMLTLFLIGLMIPMQATLLPLFLFLRKTGAYNTYFALILPYVGFAIPMAIYIFVGFLKSIPQEMEESAFIDGANLFQIFGRIMLPLIKPAMATVAIFTYLACWNELMFAITFISKEEFKTLTVGIMGMVGMYATRWGELGAGLVVATMPTIIIYVLMSKQVEKSFTTGAVKG
ncbi:carbohydrate ABC transporter permease [Vallitalea okinawensis]|uniref:carbohydrate ABC transporter permease n=1 Tax=Vallitalea okinawensis TaxID=2078660 RepID=UPI000CFC5CCA|nr:carbohydrate ABC transporter permease [Vallitalea okinawensis]